MCHPAWGRALTAAQRLNDLARLRRVRDRIDREYAQPLNVEELARSVHMSAGHLSRQFRLAYGEPPYAYLMTRRIERAMALLRRGDLSVTEAGFDQWAGGHPSSRLCTTSAMTVVTTLSTAPASGGAPPRPANSRCPAPISVSASVSTSASAAMRPISRSMVR
ncbi:helix-turn-helix transcriptional regulator [Sphaerisporangium flaviroseum]|uniref:helix-turn-helix transcriptional regulator n=1 Tax=Sphaerisporangium flaviroseum TaxID=509199 RepID=UPI003CD0818D